MYVIEFEGQGTYFVADDQEPTKDKSKAAAYWTIGAALRDIMIIKRSWELKPGTRLKVSKL